MDKEKNLEHINKDLHAKIESLFDELNENRTIEEEDI